MKRRKKVCPICGRKLWLRDFYRQKEGKPSSYCKECTSKWKREWYGRKRKKPDGIFMHPDFGRLMEHKGATLRIFWSANMLATLKRFFPTTKTAEVAEMLGVSRRTADRKAKELGLEKDPAFIESLRKESIMVAGMVSRKTQAGWFRKGHTAWNKGLGQTDNI